MTEMTGPLSTSFTHPTPTESSQLSPTRASRTAGPSSTKFVGNSFPSRTSITRPHLPGSSVSKSSLKPTSAGPRGGPAVPHPTSSASSGAIRIVMGSSRSLTGSRVTRLRVSGPPDGIPSTAPVNAPPGMVTYACRRVPSQQSPHRHLVPYGLSPPDLVHYRVARLSAPPRRWRDPRTPPSSSARGGCHARQGVPSAGMALRPRSCKRLG